MLPFWAMTAYYAYKCLKDNLAKDYIILGIVAAFGFLSKYLFIYLLIGIKVFYIFYIKKNNFKINYIIPGIVFLLILTPHLIWLTDNNYITITYGLKRTGEIKNYLDHIILPLTFLVKQIGILIPFFILLFILTKSLKTNFPFKDQNLLFLLAIAILPIVLIFFTSVIMGEKIRVDRQVVKSVIVFIRNSPFDKSEKFFSRSKKVDLPIPSDDSILLTKVCIQSLKEIFLKGPRYQKAGVIFSGLSRKGKYDEGLFTYEKKEKSQSLMKAIDKTNFKFGRNMITVADTGFCNNWRMRRGHSSKIDTSSYDFLPTINIR